MNSPAPQPSQLSPNDSLTASEKLTYCTVRIECRLADNTSSTGTGFFFAFLKEGDQHVPAIVTNRHVIREAVTGQFRVTRRDANGQQVPGDHVSVFLDKFESRWIDHPSKDVDLCIMPIAGLLTAASQQGKQLFYVTLDDTLLPLADDLRDLGALEDIVMIGYPIGIWDSVNNMPILRRGVTATHPNLDYEGRKEFLIDAACFPGSSGSPVLLFNPNGWVSRGGNIVMGTPRIRLLGILRAGPQYAATGEIKIVDVPTQQRAVAHSAIPINLGLVIKAERLLDFQPVLRAMIQGSK